MLVEFFKGLTDIFKSCQYVSQKKMWIATPEVGQIIRGTKKFQRRDDNAFLGATHPFPM